MCIYITPSVFLCIIACCYGVAKFIVQNKLPAVLWLGSTDLLQVTISGVDWQNTIGFLVGREVLQVFLVGVKFRLVRRTVQNPCRTLNMRHPIHSCSYKVRRVMFSKLENFNRTRKWREQYREPGSFPEKSKIARH